MRSRPLSLAILYACLLLTPVLIWLTATRNVAAETGSASCGGKRTVTCNAYRCVCIDNSGCTGYDIRGNVVQDEPCDGEFLIF